MSSVVGVFFNKEITCLPRLLDKYIGKYYNNALGNAVTWAFCIWIILHVIFDRFVKAVLKQMKYPEYLRSRITATLWSFGFGAGSFVYCFATLTRNNIDVFNFHKIFFNKDFDNIPGQYVLGLIVLSTYYAHNLLWESTQNYNVFKAIEAAVFTLLALLVYINGLVELLYVLTYVSNFLICVLELSRSFSFQVYNRSLMKMIATLYFILHVGLCMTFYLIVMPLYVLVPSGKHLATNFAFSFLLLNITVWVWMILSIYNSALLKLIQHYVWHTDDEETICKQSLIECAMFSPRTDTAFNIFLLQQEIKDRKDKLVLQKKKPTIALYQTLKCMVTVKRHVKERRESRENALRETDKNSEIIVKQILNEVIDEAVSQAEADTTESDTD